MRIAVFANTSWYLFNFRMNLMTSLQQEGHDVIAVGPNDSYVKRIEGRGVEHVELSLAGSRVNPASEIITILRLVKILRENKIDLVLSFTPKANIYASIVSIPLKATVFCNISGLGRVFIKKTFLTSLVKRLYRFSLVHSEKVFFQNTEDMRLFINDGLVRENKVEVLPGSGVDLDKFKPPIRKNSKDRDSFVFLLIARLLWDKGVGEFVDAARILRVTHPEIRCQLLGSLGNDNPSSIPKSVVDKWVDEGVIEYLGVTDEVETYLDQADCVVLPSYREGTPRSLLEAASMAIPIITTDSVGCRNTVDDGVTGFLCRSKDKDDLRDKMQKMIDLTIDQRELMGKRGREKMEREYSEKLVIDAYLAAIAEYTNTLEGAE